MDTAMLYGRIYLIGLPFLMMYNLSRQIVISCGESRIPLLAVLASSVLNIILDMALVGPLGVAGAAAASDAGMPVYAGISASDSAYLRLSTSLSGKHWFRDILRRSVPNTLQQIAPSVAALVSRVCLER